MENPVYTNRHGETVVIQVTDHARIRFRQRWTHAFPKQPPIEPIDKMLAEWFSKAKRIQPESRRYRTRLRRHGKDTLYFAAPPFVFVVQSAALITVELASRDTRHLNKMRSIPIEAPLVSASPLPENIPGNYHSKISLFRLTACALDESGATRFVNLGSYDSTAVGNVPERLRNDKVFQTEAMKRFQSKRSSWTLIAVFATLGRKGDHVTVFSVDERLPTTGHIAPPEAGASGIQ